MEEVVAGAVIGTTVSVVLKNLLSFPVEEIGLVWNFKKDLQKLKKSLLTIRDFLEDAETKQVTDKPIQRWLMKLEALVFYADYVFDQLSYEVLRKKVETDNKMKKKVSSFFATSNPIAFRLRMARKIKEIKNEFKSINQEAMDLGLQVRFSGVHARGEEALAYPETDSLSMDRIFIGPDNDAAKIVEMVSNTPTEQLDSVLPIVGMGGLGKTKLARKVFNGDTIISHFGKCIWVYVSRSFVPETVFKSVLASLTGENIDGSREVVLQKLQERIGEKKYLLVLDDVWNEDIGKWDNFITSLEAISRVKGNVVIVTTRKQNVASIVKTIDILELEVLSVEGCWYIIKANAFGKEYVPSYILESNGKKIAKRCGGLPLAAKVVGSLLRGKSEDEWLTIEKRWLSDFGEDNNIVSKILKLSFDNLLTPSMKKCFAYCSIIPKGWSIEREEMIHLWMAEGFLQTDQEKDIEIVGNTTFNVLVQSSLLQVEKPHVQSSQVKGDYFENVKVFVMHDLVHDLASSVLNSMFLDDAHQVRYISRSLTDESSPIPKEHANGLLGLFFTGKVSHIMFSNLKCLHVLILNDGEMEELPVEIGKLISLRYLDISHTRMECLPDSIGDLYHLQTLRATKEYGGEGCLRKLPDTFKLLTSLRHYIPDIKLPPKIGKLIHIQTLPYFRVGDEEGCGIVELGSLNNLKGEREIHNLEKVRDKNEAKYCNAPIPSE